MSNADSAGNANIAGIVQKCCVVRCWHCRRYWQRRPITQLQASLKLVFVRMLTAVIL
jgi:hypothetical protein